MGELKVGDEVYVVGGLWDGHRATVRAVDPAAVPPMATVELAVVHCDALMQVSRLVPAAGYRSGALHVHTGGRVWVATPVSYDVDLARWLVSAEGAPAYAVRVNVSGRFAHRPVYRPVGSEGWEGSHPTLRDAVKACAEAAR